MKIVVALDALPWEAFNIAVTDAEGKESRVSAKSSAVLAGFLPLYWSEEIGKAARPNAQFQEIEVADDWHPMIEALRKSAEVETTEKSAE
jgi:hypothetical protein